MKCFVCEGDMSSYMTKKYPYTGLIDEAVFLKCENCGMVINETMYELSPEKWKELNLKLHKQYQGMDYVEGDPKWITRLRSQAKVLFGMFSIGLLKTDMNCVDYGCGDGKLSDYVDELLADSTARGIVKKYDKFMSNAHGGRDKGYLTEGEIKEKAFDVVITCSVFEHLVGLDDVDYIIKLLNPNCGVLGVHTLVCEDVPQDENWFYIDFPMHCTIWTNKAMKKLFELYRFKGCAYHLEAQMWFFFYDEAMFVKLKKFHKNIPGSWFFSNEFVDYWKQKPYR